MPILRALTGEGIAAFEAYLAGLAESPTARPPLHLLTENGFSQAIPGGADISVAPFADKLEMARYVANTIPDAVRESNPIARNIWVWLTVLWLDQLLPPEPASGARKPNRPWYYVPGSTHFVEYRHLLMGPYRAYQAYGEGARLLLLHPLHVWSDVEEQLAGKREFLRLPGALAAADLLYFDAVRNRVKRGITNRKKPGNIRRLRDVVRQFNRTYDLHSMTGDQVVSMLPAEFDAFRS